MSVHPVMRRRNRPASTSLLRTLRSSRWHGTQPDVISPAFKDVRILETMQAEIVHIVDCAGGREVARLLRAALDATGHQTATITHTLIDSPAVAAEVWFAGSPTILIDGTDLFPSAGRIEHLACRVYPTPGGFSGSPTEQQLREAIAARG